MAELTGKAVSELPEATNVQDSDLLAISQDAASKKVTVETLLKRAIPITVTVDIIASTSSQQIGSVTDSKISANTKVIRSEIANPEYQTSDWTVTTSDYLDESTPNLIITGMCFAATTVNLILAEVE